MMTPFAPARAASKHNVNGIINLLLKTSSCGDRKKMCRWFNVPGETVSFTLTDLVGWSTSAAKEAIEKLAAQVTHITGQVDPVILLELGTRTFAEMGEAWRPLVAEHLAELKRKHLASVKPGVRKANKLLSGPNSISSPSKENENENGDKRESESFSSPPALRGSAERRVRRLPASLPSLSSTPSPRPTPKPILSALFRSPISLSRADRHSNLR